MTRIKRLEDDPLESIGQGILYSDYADCRYSHLFSVKMRKDGDRFPACFYGIVVIIRKSALY